MQKDSFFLKYLAMGFFFLGIGFLGEQFGLFFSKLNRLAGLYCLLLYILISLMFFKRYFENRSYSFYIWIVVLMLLLTFAPLPVISIGYAILIPLILGLRESKTHFQVGLFFLIYTLLNSFSPQFFLFESLAANFFNYIIEKITNQPIQLSPYAYGFGGLTILIGFALSQVKAYQFRKKLLNNMIIITFIILGYLFFHALYFWLSIPYYNIGLMMENNRLWYSILKLLFPMNGQGLIFILIFSLIATIKYFTVNWDDTLIEKKQSNKEFSAKFKLLILVLLGLILIAFYWNLDLYESVEQNPSVYVYDTKMNFTTIPDDNIYGMNNGMYGMMFRYFQDWGYQIELCRDLGKIRPENNDILVLFNPNEQMKQLNLKKVKEFIFKGGRLLYFGDHTFMSGLTNRYSDFLDQMGITFNFDTAVSFRPDWRCCLRSPLHTWDLLLKRDNFTTGITLGASLTVRYPASPLIIGRYGWSDLGNIENKPVFFGDLKLTPNEPMGDIVLAAERNYGKGKILVFGDSTFMQNTPISNSYPLARLVLIHLKPRNHILLRIALPCFYFVGLLIIILFRKVSLKSNTFYFFTILPFLALIWAGSTIGREQAYFQIPSKTIQLKAGIDFTVYPEFYRKDWGSDNRGVGGLKNNLCRIGVIPYLVYQYNAAQLKKLDYFFIMGPKKKISPAKTMELLTYVRDGGVLICACGFEHQEQISELLAAIDLNIVNTPLSILSEKDTNLQICFVSAWPIQINNKNANIIGTAFGKYPVVVKVVYGKGKILLIGDSYFFENRNLEDDKVFHTNNLGFVKQVLTSLKQ